ncbi:UNVERIFIED_CONTAM: hypothetical protein Sradi_5754300 [Sesamum radiatum]|uniref:Uncharacterized protein n=1 Tax=Sesamum radiatum TaxID=300843 RepID=A0AAW2L2T6_SESRA
MELGVDFHPGPGIYAYYLGPCCAELLDIGTSYPIRATTVAMFSKSSTSPSVGIGNQEANWIDGFENHSTNLYSSNIVNHRPNGTTMQQLDRALDGGYEINYQGLGLECFKSRTSRMGIESPVETCTKSRIHWMSAVFHRQQT